MQSPFGSSDTDPKRETVYTRGQDVDWDGKGPRTNGNDYRKLVGDANEADIKMDGKWCRTLLDTGSTVSTVCKSYFDEHLYSHRINPVQDLLELEGAGGHSLPYFGYVEVDIEIPGIIGVFEVLLLVVPDTRYGDSVPVILGTNMLRPVMDAEIKQHGVRWLQKTATKGPWQLAYRCLNFQDKQLDRRNGQLCLVRNAEERPVVLYPNMAVNILGEVDNRLPYSKCLAMSQPCSESMISKDMEVTPALYTYDHKGDGKILIALSNPTTQTLVIQPRAKLCELHHVIKDQMSSTSPDAIPAKWMEDVSVNLEALTIHQRKEVLEFLSKWEDVFSQNDLDIGITSLVKHQIHLADDTPFRQRHRRIPPHMYEEVKEHLEQLLEGGIIRKSHSPWASNMVLVRKKDGSLRVCVDYRELNAKTVKDAYTLPRIDEMLDRLAGSCYFSILDMKSGYHQVEVEETHKQRTAFTAGPLGFYEYNRLPFGLSNAPATYQRLMEDCLDGLNHHICLVYLDDIIIFADSYQKHLDRLEQVFKRLRTCGMKLSKKKCSLFQEKVKYVGHIVSSSGIEPDPEKVEKVKDWPVPTDVNELRQFLGFAGYYRKFIKDFSKMARPLNDLLAGGSKTGKKRRKMNPPLPALWKWGEEQNAAFLKLKECLTTPPVLGYADFSHPFELHTDASGEGLGAVLCQRIGEEQTVIAYASRGLSRSERNYSAHKLEFLALKWAITEKFHEYLYGSRFTVLTDNNPLTYVLTKAKLDATGHRWLASLSAYNFNIKYRPGTSNADADALSRLPSRKLDQQGYAEIAAEVIGALNKSNNNEGLLECIVMSRQMVESNSTGTIPVDDLGVVSVNNWEKLQQEDQVIKLLVTFIDKQERPTRQDISDHPELKPYLRVFDALTLRSGVLYRKLHQEDDILWQLVLPTAYRQQALEGLHDRMGHLGRDRTLHLARQRFYWPNMGNDVAAHIKKCGRCIRRKSSINIRAPLVSIETKQPLELVCLDFLSLEASKGGYNNILVITDHFTRYALAIPTRNQTARTTAEALWNGFIVHYGFPSRLHTDQGANFCSKLMKELCQISGMEKSRTTPYHPMGNGMCERFNKTLLEMLGTLEPCQKADWKKYVGPMIHAYNSTRHESTGFTPFYLMYGREPRLPIDLAMGLVTEEEAQNYTDFVESLRKRLQKSYDLAKKRSAQAQQQNKANYDQRARAAVLEVGDRVLVKVLAFGGKHKIADRWEEDPYVILAQPNEEIPVYTVRKESGQGRRRTLHRNNLLPIGGLLLSEEKPPIGKQRPKPHQEKQRPKPCQEILEETEQSSDVSSEDEDEYVIQYHVPEMADGNNDGVSHHSQSETHGEVDQQSNQEADVEQPQHDLEADVEQPQHDLDDDVEQPQHDLDDEHLETSTVESIASETLENSEVADESDEPLASPSPPRRRSTRARKPPTWMRSGNWVMHQRCFQLPRCWIEVEC
jgi:transposase InsO family protein